MLAQTVAVLVLPCVAVGVGKTVNVNVVDADEQVPLLTVMVSVTVAPDDLSAALKVYDGVSVVALLTIPLLPEVLLAVHAIVPLLDA